MFLSRLQKIIPSKVILACVFLAGCTDSCEKNHEEMSAEEVVEAYLEISLNMTSVDQREDLIEYTTGRLKDKLESATDEAIVEGYIKKNYNLQRFSIVDRADKTPRETEITYELEYNQLGQQNAKPEDAATTTTENTVSLIKKKKKWFLSDVLNNETTIEFPLTDENTIKGKAN